MQQLMMLLDQDQYIRWHRLKDENVVRDLFWSHPDAVKLTNSCNLFFFLLLLTIPTKQIGTNCHCLILLVLHQQE